MRWVVGERSPEKERRLVCELGITPLVAASLAARGVTDPDLAREFLQPSLDSLGDPALLPDYRAAADRLLLARERKEKVFVHGDYDVDGVTSTALLGRFLLAAGWDVTVHVPHRIREGYGIHATAVEAAAEMGASVFLTCDCGISAHEQVALANERGMDVIVTDHHHVGVELPGAIAVINPHRADSRYPFAELSGVGVVFRFCEGLTRDLEMPVERYRDAYLDLAALGTIADMMPLVGENRIIARHGLARLAATKKKGLIALMKSANVRYESDGRISARAVGWLLGPRINAAGRIDDAAKALDLLLTRDDDEAEALATELDALNLERREKQAKVIEEADAIVAAQNLSDDRVIVVVGEGWHAGIVGIVAGRLAERYHRPVFVLHHNLETGIMKGSARSIPGFHLAAAIESFPELMNGGGHAAAAGCSFEASRIDDVRAALNGLAAATLSDEDLLPVVVADFEVGPDEIDLQATEELVYLEPFGHENPDLRVLARRIPLVKAEPTRDGKHLRLTLRAGRGTTAMGWHMGPRASELSQATHVDAIFSPQINDFRDQRTVQWILSDVRPSA